MSQIIYRALQRNEADLLRFIDRSERIDGVYRKTGSSLLLEATLQMVAPWQRSELDDYVSRLHAVLAAGGHAHGAWDASQLVAFAALDVAGVNGEPTTLKLDLLYVSAGYRGRGIGRKLTELVAAQARSLGARTLYISATPTRGTVDAYLRMGAEVNPSPDPDLLAREPEDIHLILRLG
jgi:GNAT superfamily N-acetyltransferase